MNKEEALGILICSRIWEYELLLYGDVQMTVIEGGTPPPPEAEENNDG